MKKIILFIFAILMIVAAFSACNNVESLTEEGNNLPVEIDTPKEEKQDPMSEKITDTRKKVYEVLNANNDILETIENPSDYEAIPYEKIEGLPDSAGRFVYDYFNYRVTLEEPEGWSYIYPHMRFLIAARRLSNDVAEGFTVEPVSIVTLQKNANNDFLVCEATLVCHVKRPDSAEGKPDNTNTESIKILFTMVKENDEWTLDGTEFVGGEPYEYAKSCIDKTNGFPELDANSEYSACDAAIVEYSEKLYDFGFIPNGN